MKYHAYEPITISLNGHSPHCRPAKSSRGAGCKFMAASPAKSRARRVGCAASRVIAHRASGRTIGAECVARRHDSVHRGAKDRDDKPANKDQHREKHDAEGNENENNKFHRELFYDRQQRLAAKNAKSIQRFGISITFAAAPNLRDELRAAMHAKLVGRFDRALAGRAFRRRAARRRAPGRR